ncbi:plexin-C1-like [Xiphophorus maculatus]|uniref:plexin-C1-like n=1 Tax=Xiphophorus maculatus TaxID=8083 RepID=UPI000C6CCB24|nr:plexin-C1-like [Xiphophorus maculatus]
MILLLCLLCMICGEPVWSLENGEFSFKGDIQQVAIGSNNLYIATTEALYQLRPNFALIHSLTLRGTLQNGDQPGKKVLDLKNISKLVYSESIQVGPQRSSSGSVSFLVDVTEKPGVKPGIQTEADVEFVDGFQINSTVYLFSNVASGGETNKVRLIWLQAETSKTQTLESLHGATLSSSGGSRLLASSVVPGGQQVLWSGVFSVDGGESNTELLLFDVSPDISREKNKDPDFYTSVDKPNNPSGPKALKPHAVLSKKKYMSSVLAVKQDSWTVFFIGTTDGQLIKLPVDKNNRPACPKEHYRASGNQKVFPKILLDPVDHKQMYLIFKDKIKRVPVSNCSEYMSVEDCCTDPFCVWCVSEKRCTFKDDCKYDWISIPDEYQQEVISYRAEKDSTGQVKVVVNVHLTLAQNIQSEFTCAIVTNVRRLCGTLPQYPQCTCVLSDDFHSNELDLILSVRLEAVLTKSLKLIDCSDSTLSCQQCIRAGCGWRENRCTWDSEGVRNDRVCQPLASQPITAKPEIISVSPSRVSYYGRNHALLKGRNLRDVIGVKVQTETACSKEANEAEAKVCAVLSDGSCHGEADITYQSAPSCTGVSPSVTWRSGKRKITITGSYLDTVEMVTHNQHVQELEFYRGLEYPVQEEYPPQLQVPPEHINSTTLIYKTLPVEPSEWNRPVVNIKVANQTLSCSAKMFHRPDPQFINFRAKRTGDNIKITILKIKDELMMTTEELSIWGIKDDKQYPCILQNEDDDRETTPSYEYGKHSDFEYGSRILVCEIQNTTDVIFNQLKIMYGETIVRVWNPSLLHQVLLILRLMFLPSVAVVLMIICQCQKRRVVQKTKL